jgi:hypothetical protein
MFTIILLGAPHSRRRQMYNRAFGAPGSRKRRWMKRAGWGAGAVFVVGFLLPVLLGGVILIRRSAAEARHHGQGGVKPGVMPTGTGRAYPGTRRPAVIHE